MRVSLNLLLIAVLAQAKLVCKRVPGRGDYSVCWQTPKSFYSSGSKKFPVLTFLSGSGARGSFANAAQLSTYSGVGYVLDQELKGNSTTAGKFIYENFLTVFIIAPETEQNRIFDPNVVRAGVFELFNIFREKITRDKVYLSGYSMGCRGTLRELVFKGETFAAALCSAGYAEKAGDDYLGSDPAALPTFPRLGNVVETPIWFYASKSDNTNAFAVTKGTYDEIQRKRGSSVKKCNRFTTIPNLDHSAMHLPQFAAVASYKWLLQHSLGYAQACNLKESTSSHQRRTLEF